MEIISLVMATAPGLFFLSSSSFAAVATTTTLADVAVLAAKIA